MDKSGYAKWYEKNIDQVRAYKRAKMRELRARSPEKYRGHGRSAASLLRARLFEAYGHTCASCGFSDKRALTLDHVLNNGSAERSELGERGVYRRALQPSVRAEYQILCMNCQFIKRSHGVSSPVALGGNDSDAMAS